MEVSVMIRKDPDGKYVAISPTMPQCISRGNSPKEALDEHRIRIRQFVAVANDSFPDSIKFHVIGEHSG